MCLVLRSSTSSVQGTPSRNLHHIVSKTASYPMMRYISLTGNTANSSPAASTILVASVPRLAEVTVAARTQAVVMAVLRTLREQIAGCEAAAGNNLVVRSCEFGFASHDLANGVVGCEEVSRNSLCAST